MNFRTLHDAILHNLQVLCESTQHIDERYRQKHLEINWKSIAACETCFEPRDARDPGSSSTKRHNKLPDPACLGRHHWIALLTGERFLKLRHILHHSIGAKLPR